MTRFKQALLIGALALAASAGVAKADIYVPTWTVQVWTTTSGTIGGTNFINAAELPTPTVAADESFTYTGPIDFVNNNGQGQSNTFGDFFSHSGNISGLSSSVLSTFLGTTMSSAGSSNYSYLDFTLVSPGSVSSGTTVSLSHDDGASLYANSTTNALISSPGETSFATESATLPTGPLSNLTVAYIEANGSPADLILNVPEPGSLMLLGTGLVGLGLLSRRRRRAG